VVAGTTENREIESREQERAENRKEQRAENRKRRMTGAIYLLSAF